MTQMGWLVLRWSAERLYPVQADGTGVNWTDAETEIGGDDTQCGGREDRWIKKKTASEAEWGGSSVAVDLTDRFHSGGEF